MPVIVFAAISLAVIVSAAILSAVIKVPIPPDPPNAWNVASFVTSVLFWATATKILPEPTAFVAVVVVCKTVVDVAIAK